MEYILIAHHYSDEGIFLGIGEHTLEADNVEHALTLDFRPDGVDYRVIEVRPKNRDDVVPEPTPEELEEREKTGQAFILDLNIVGTLASSAAQTIEEKEAVQAFQAIIEPTEPQ